MTGRDYRAALTQHAEKFGTQILTVFGGELTDRNQSPSQALERFPALVADVAALKGPQLAVTLCTDTGTGYDVADHCRKWGRLLSDPAIRPHVASVVIWNEIGHPSQRKVEMSELCDLRWSVINEGFNGPIALGALIDLDEMAFDGSGYPADTYPPMEGPNVPPHGSGSVHLNRGKKPSYRESMRTYEQFKIQQHYNAAVANYEPGRWDHEDLRTESDPYGHLVFSFLLGALGAGLGLATVGHSSALRDCVELSGLELDCMSAFIRGHSSLPRGTYHFENANNTNRWPNSPIASAAFVEGPASTTRQSVWRIYSFRNEQTGKWYAVLGGPDILNPDTVFQNGYSRLDSPIALVGQMAGVYPIS